MLLEITKKNKDIILIFLLIEYM